MRLPALNDWLDTLFPGRGFSLAPASSDASFRRYFRVHFEDEATPRIVMDAPPEHEDCAPFLKVQALFSKAGAHVPEVFASDLAQGFLLLSDLGDTPYLSALNASNARALYGDATDALIKIQLASRPGVLPDYSREVLLREMALFPTWYLERHLGQNLQSSQQAVLQAAFETIIEVNRAEPTVFVHRDFHSRNLMLHTPNPGVIDFQDALWGPISYDLVSLFRDAYIEWPEETVLDNLIRYWEKARQQGLPVRQDFGEFYRDFEWMGVQRHLKVLGIFARLYHRDGKEGYLKDMPLVLKYLRSACARYRELHPLLKLIDDIHAKASPEGAPS
jgi:aminoglycoside/choline kinase family phosphotransferase